MSSFEDALAYTASEISGRNAKALASAAAVRAKTNTTAQRGTADVNHFMWYGQSEWQGWQSTPALMIKEGYDCLMFGQAPRPRAVAGNDPNVSTYQPVGDSLFRPLASVCQDVGTGQIVEPARGGFTSVRGAVFNEWPPMLTFTGGTATEIRQIDGALIKTDVGGDDQLGLDFTRIFLPSSRIVFTGLAGSWAWIGNNHYWVEEVTPTALKLVGTLPTGVPDTQPQGFNIHAINGSLDVLGEEPGVSALTFLRRLQINYRAAADNHQLLLTNSCIGGVSIKTLSKQDGSKMYNRLPDAAAKVRAVGETSGKTSVVPAIVFAQGGTDCQIRTTYADYAATTVRLVSDLRADITATTGQQKPPIFLTFQVSGPNLTGNDDFDVPMAQLDLALNPPNPDWYMIGPFYFVPDQQFPYRGVHWTANGERWAGHLTGKVLHKILDLGEGWLPLHPISITHRGQAILIDFHVPEPPLQFQPACLGWTPTLFPDRGFAISDNDGPTAVSSVSIIADCLIEIVCARPLNGVVTVQYGDTKHHGAGNLCDSDPLLTSEKYLYTDFNGQMLQENIEALVDKPYPLWNWCVLFKRISVAA